MALNMIYRGLDLTLLDMNASVLAVGQDDDKGAMTKSFEEMLGVLFRKKKSADD